MPVGKSEDIFVAKESFSTVIDNVPTNVIGGITRVRKGHPLLKGREALFEALDVHYDVEQATARPGEKRGAEAPVVPAPEPEPTPTPAADVPSKDEEPSAEQVKADALAARKAAPTVGMSNASFDKKK